MAETFQPIGQVLNGIEILDLLPDSIAMDAVVLVKCLDEDGDPCWYTRYTEGLSTAETIGALTMALDLCRDEARGLFRPHVAGED